MAPFYYLVERGEDPVAAYRRTYDRVMRGIEFRTWYRGQPLGDGNEAEHVLFTAREDLGNPWTSLAKGAAHEARLKEWRAMGPQEQVLDKMAGILEAADARRARGSRSRWGGRVEGGGARVGARAFGALDAAGSDGEDSIDLMVGNTTDGGYGVGWKNDDGATSEFPFDGALAEKLANEVLDDKIEEEDDRQAILGKDLVNPTTGLTLVDYLEGREALHNETLLRRYGLDGDGDAPDADTLLDSEDLAPLKAAPRLGAWTEARLLRHLRAADALEDDAGDPYAAGARAGDVDWAAEGSETRFETESDVMELCDLAETLGTLDEAEEIVARARMWRWKPYGEVTLRFAQDAQGKPVELMQDALHYPHGTKWMAPGPLGQVHPLPADRALRVEMARVAKNHAAVHRMYNFDADPRPGSAEWAVEQRMRRAQELQLRRLERLEAAVGEEEALAAEAEAAAAAGGGAQPTATIAEAAGAAAAAASSSGSGFGGSGFGFGARGGSGGGGAPFASMTLGGGFGSASSFALAPQGIGRASRAVLNTLSRAARRAPTLAVGRPRVARPAARKAQQASAAAAGGSS